MKLLLGDCKEKLKELEDNSIDAIVTDPPYGLSFMGKKWDYDVPSVDIWKECLRVLKPGGYLLSFAGTRTQHRMAVNIEDAGFEIRDMIAWIYASGFPKSLNIGKAVARLQGEDIPKTKGFNVAGQGIGLNPNKELRSDHPDYVKPTYDNEWEGWGTALKPALEPITVARKPLGEKTVAENCLKWGVGGINIDGCRVGGQAYTQEQWRKKEESRVTGNTYGKHKPSKTQVPTGRFPANLIHDGSDEVVGLFPQTKSGKLKSDCYEKDRENDSMFAGGENFTHKGYEADSGSASRFFKTCEFAEEEAQRFLYTAKASKRERNIGCEGLEEVDVRTMNDFGDQSKHECSDGVKRTKGTGISKAKNNHPTVKPIALMEYLVKLVSREGQVVLDPFMGSGTTGMACKRLDREFIGIEMMPDYMEIAKARIDGVKESKQLEQLNLLKDNK